jgi:hypothetical protein
MEDDREPHPGRPIELPSPILFKTDGMKASLVPEDGDQVIVQRERLSVIDYRGKSVQEVLIDAPTYTQRLRYLQYRVYLFPVAEMYIVTPFGVIRVEVIAEPGE